ncbi:MAG: LLM class flavin-dependent oxidoreductase [Deltaproteobacteria bacterium]|nr:MAG: LLM class flavin-dependent oxidoreductase [Deltaproteobacteria bacterium]
MASLELGIVLGGGVDRASWARALERVEQAEALGLHSVWLPEGHFQPGATASPLLALSAFAARTRRLRLGTTSLLLPVHHPLHVAREVATLDRLSGGRVWLGLGRGFRAPLFRGYGVARRDKRDLFDQTLDAILAAWQPAAPDGANGALQPLQRPRPPLFVAAFGRKGLLQAARRGLPYLASPLETLDALAENYAYHRERLAPEIDADALPVAVLRTVHVASDDAEARRVIEALETEAGRLSARAPAAIARAGAGRARDRVLVGTVEPVADALAAYRGRIGLDLLIARTDVPGADASQRRASLERLRFEVVPRFGTQRRSAVSPTRRPAPRA